MKKVLVVTALARFIKSFLTNDIRILQSMGYEVHCAANINHVGAEGMEKYFEEMNVVFHQIGFSSNKPISKETLSSYREMKKLIKDEKFDVVHCHTPIVGVITRIVCRKQRKKGLKVLYTTHGFYFHKYSGWKSWAVYRTIENWMSRYSDAMITINHEDFCNAQKMQCDCVYYIPSVGVDVKRFMETQINRDAYRRKIGVKEDDLLILAIGELSGRKNHQIIIKALAEAKLQNAVFMICGNAMTSANTKDALEKMAIEYGVDLRLMGLRDDVPEICKCADIGVFPSSREGLGLAGVEMLASGLPVVASNVQGIVDYVVDGKNGYLCNPFKEQEFSEALLKLVSKEKRQEMKSECIKSAEPFEKRHSHEKMRKIYYEVLD